MSDREEKVLNECRDIVSQLQNFPPSSIDRRKSLGDLYSFVDSVSAAARLVDFYKLIRLEHLDMLPLRQVLSLRDIARETMGCLNAILAFSPADVTNPNDEYSALRHNLESNYQKTFNGIYALVGFLSLDVNRIPKIESQIHKYTDEIRGEIEVLRHTNKSSLDEFKVEAESMLSSIEKSKDQASQALDVIQGVAAESGVSAQSAYFEIEAGNAEDAASRWF